LFSNTYTVTVLTDNGGVNPAVGAGTGTLRQAIIDANANAGADIINFNLGVGGPFTITLDATLPSLTDNSGVTIDGWDNSGNDGTPNTISVFNATTTTPMNAVYKIILANGANISTGLVLASNNNIIKGLVLQDFGDGTIGANDVAMTISGNANQVLGCIIGLDYLGITGTTKTHRGISISGNTNAIGDGTAAGANIISGMNNAAISPVSGGGIYITGAGATGNMIKGNMIGLQCNGSTFVVSSTQGYGVYLTASASNNIIGGSISGEGNVISGMYTGSGGIASSGIYINSAVGVNAVRGNIIGLQANGTTMVASNFQTSGIEISTSPNNTIGGSTAAERNIISGNENAGVLITGASGGNVMKGNYIGLDITGTSIITGSSQDNGIWLITSGSQMVGGIASGEGNVISGNTGSGISIVSDGGAYVYGNIIGTQKDGATLLASNTQQNGLYVVGDNNVIGGATAAHRNIISGNQSSGITFQNTNGGNTVQGNYIGLDITGTSVIIGSSQDHGIRTFASADYVVIGGSAAGEGNVISGNTHSGIIFEVNGAHHTVKGNIIGLQADGLTYLASNAQVRGINIDWNSNMTIGGSAPGDRNIISGNTTYGIYVDGLNAGGLGSGNAIKGNYIGPDGTGNNFVTGSSQDYGVYLDNYSSSTTIGGSALGEGNVISGNTNSGIYIDQNLSNTVYGNIIGLQSDGLTYFAGAGYTGANTQDNGIYISNSSNNIIGSSTSTERNIISGNETYGIYVTGASSTGNVIKGNYIGLQSNGTTIVTSAAQDYGITIATSAASNTIGGIAAGEGNVLSGNSNTGVYVASGAGTGNNLYGNIIGLQKDGNTAVASSTQIIGVQLSASSSVVGGNTSAHRNILSGNTSSGIILSQAQSLSNIVQGNYIGLQSNGTTIVGSQPYGLTIELQAANNIVGGTGAGEGNVISGNSTYGINSTSTLANSIYGNIVGLQQDGNTLVASSTQQYGILLNQAANHLIGGNTSAHRNIISGNTFAGIFMTGASCAANNIKGNYIGPNNALGNIVGSSQNYGVYMQSSAANNIIGGPTTGDANMFVYNTVAGLYLTASATKQNLISRNPIYFNSNKPINLNYGASGGNNNQPIPTIATNSTIANVFGTAVAGDSVELFKNTTGNCYDAVTYLGTAVANASGVWTIPVSLTTSDYILATATDANKNTSEFTTCRIPCNLPAASGSQNVSICSNETYTLPGGTVVNTANTYIDTILTVGGCDSIVTTNLTVRPVSATTQNITICFGDSLLVGSVYYYNTGNYLDTLVAANGCDSVVTTNLIESPAITTTQNVTMCFGDSVLVGSTYYYATGNYTDILVAANGCDSTVTTNLIESPAITTTQNITICFGDSLLVGSTYYYNTGNYIDVLVAANGCDSTVTTNLIESPAIATTQNITICFGDSLLVGSAYYYNTGNYTDVLVAANGCDSTVTTNLIESPAITTTQNITICFGDSVLVGATYYYNTGNYTDVLVAANGCDSTVTTNLIESPAITTTQNITICNGDSVLVGSAYYYNTGNYTDVLVAANGCDSTVTTNLIESPAITTTQNLTICFGDSVLVGSVYYYNTGNYVDVLIAANGCDSTVTTNLIESPAIITNQTFTLCQGQSVTVGGNTYTTTGIYTDVLTANNGCDSTVNTNLSVTLIITTTQNITICNGDSILVGSNFYYNSGVYVDTMVAVIGGCDSVMTTTLTERPLIATTQNVVICFGDSVLVGSTYYYNTGNYIDTLIAANGCDSIVTTNLTESPAITTTQNITICFGDSVLVGSTYYYNTGNYIDTLLATNSCDSIVTTNLIESPAITTTQNITICNGDSLLVGSTYYYNTGNYTDVLVAANGCDSMVTTNLIESPAIITNQMFTVCQGQSVVVGGNTYTNTGIYTDVLIATNGCDSTVNTNLSVTLIITTSQNITICNGDSILVGSNTYYNSGVYVDTMVAVIGGCDSVVTTNLTERPLITTTQNITICNGDSLLVGNVYYYNTGNYTDVLVAANGCDSTVTTNLIESPAITTTQNLTICFGDSLLVGSTYYYNSGNYTDVLVSANGCDSIVTTNLTERPLIATTQNSTMCNGDSLLVGSFYYYNTGTYTTVLIASNGCDSTVITNLTENSAITSTQSYSICTGDSILVGNIYYYTSGNYTNIFTAANGCDSIVTSNINVIQPVIGNQNATILCYGQGYTLPNGTIVYIAGVYYIDTLTSSVTGCDSIFTVTVSINPSPIASFTATPTSGTAPLLVSFNNTSANATTYVWYFGDGSASTQTNPNYTYSTPGTYTVTLVASTNNGGCPDTAYTTIEVLEKFGILIPNVFTPNNDGTNDVFTINTEGVKTLVVEIYDRWGLKMYEWDGVNGGWDGYTLSGKPASDGTYYYIIKLTEINDEEHVYKGAFTLIR